MARTITEFIEDNEGNNNIYSSVEVEIDYSNESKNFLRQFFKDNPNEYHNSKDLEVAFDFKSNVALRKAITELIEEEGLPIISSVKGYKLTTDPEEIHVYIESLNSRIKGIERRIKSLQRFLNEY